MIRYGALSWRYRKLRLAICMGVALLELQSVEHDRGVLPADLTPHSPQIIFHPVEDLTSLVLVRIAIEPKKVVRTFHPQPSVDPPHCPLIHRPMLAQHAAPYHSQDLEPCSCGSGLRCAIYRRRKERDRFHTAGVDEEDPCAIVRHHETERLPSVGVEYAGDLVDEVPGVAGVYVMSSVNFERLVGLDLGC